jgi:hypothetical protein
MLLGIPGNANADDSWGAFWDMGRPKKPFGSSTMLRLTGGRLLPGWRRGDWNRVCGEFTSGLLGTESKKRLFCFAPPAGPRT